MYLVVGSEEAAAQARQFVEGRLRIAIQQLPRNGTDNSICLQLRPTPAQRAMAEEFHSFLKRIERVI